MTIEVLSEALRYLNAIGALLLALALLLAGGGSSPELRFLTRLFGLASGLLFLAGYAPPSILRVYWRQPEQEAMRTAVQQLMASTTLDDLERSLLPRVAAIVGAPASGACPRAPAR